MRAFLKNVFPNDVDLFKLGSSYILGAAALVACFVLAALSGGDAILNVLLCVFGGVLGWILGLFLTLSNEREKKQYTEYAKMLGSLLSGFGIAKIDLSTSWTSFASPQDNLNVKRVLLFGCSLLIVALFTYISRLYVKDPKDTTEQRQKLLLEVSERLKKLEAL